MKTLQDFSWPLYLFAQAIYLAGVSIKPTTTYRWVLFFPFASICIYLVGFTSQRNGVADYGMGCHILTILFAASDFLLLTNVQKELRLQGQLDSIAGKPILSRLKWGSNLLGSPRGIGWSFAPSSSSHVLQHPPSASTTRSAFIASKLREIAFYALLYDLTGFINRANPCFSRNGPPVAETGHAQWIWRIAMFGYAAASWLTVSTLHCAYSIVSVGIGATEPKEWVPLFGRLQDAYTVRRFWGHVWHQMMRRFLLSHTNFLAKKLGLPRQSKFTSLCKLFVAFFISAIIHFGGDYMLLHNQHDGGSFRFFLLQPCAIAFEEMIIGLSAKLDVGRRSSSRATRTLGFVWVCAWFAYSLPIMIEPHLRVGFLEDGLSFSLLLGIWKGEWIPK